MKKFSVVFIFLFVFSIYVPGQEFDSKLKEIDSYANTVINQWKGAGMAIAVVKDDKVVFAKGYGVRELGKNDPVDENTTFAIASNSKAFTAASIAILVDEGKLKWDDKVVKYLPELQMYNPYVTSELTIRDLLTHRNGLDTFSGDLLWYETNYSADEIVRRVRYLKPVSGFRTQFGYQNVMFVAAGQVIQKVSGKPWAEFVKERILDPLGMTRTSTSIKDTKDNAAFPHNESGGKLRVLPRGNVDGGAAAAGLNSSVTDLSKWVRLQLGRGTFEGKKIVDPKSIWQMWQPYMMMPVSENSIRVNPTKQFSGVGMGWFTYNYQGKKFVNHSGGLDGMLSYTVLIPEDNIGFVVLTNSEFPTFSIMMNKISDVLTNAPPRDYNAEAVASVARSKTASADNIAKIEAARKKETKPSLAIADYAGSYKDEYYGGITVTNEAGKLVFKMDGSPNLVADLEHWHFDTFRLRWRPSVSYNFSTPGFVTFSLNKDAKVEAMTIDQPNNDFWFYEMAPKRSK